MNVERLLGKVFLYHYELPSGKRNLMHITIIKLVSANIVLCKVMRVVKLYGEAVWKVGDTFKLCPDRFSEFSEVQK